MNGHVANSDKIDKYFDGKLSGRELDEFEDHIFNCDECFQQLRTREEMVHLIKKEGHILFAADLARLRARERPIREGTSARLPRFQFAWQSRWIYATAAAGALVLIFFLSNRLGLFQSQVQHMSQSKQPFEVRIDSVSYAETDSVGPRFESRADLEKLIADSSVSYLIRVTSPKRGENFESDNILFQWEIKEDAPLDLRILNNRGSEVFRVKPENDGYILTQKMRPGLYYWKLEGDGALLYVGRFVVKQDAQQE